MPGRFTVQTERLRLEALDHDALQAWVDADVGALSTLTGVRFADPPDPPPLFDDDLPMFRDRMAETPGELGWWVWLVARREDGRAVGVCGLGGRPDAEGVVVLGYAVYPDMEGQGYATEAARAVARWALAEPGVARIRATVPTRNPRSLAVARRLGMRRVGSGIHPEVGEVAVYEMTRNPQPGAMSRSGDPSDWPAGIHQGLTTAGVSVVGYVPDAGLGRLIELCRTRGGMRAVPLTSEQEGVGLAGGAWLGGARCALLMQSSGVGNLMNALGMARECRFPLVLLVTMRGEEGETNPWQIPVGRATAALLAEMGVEVARADTPDAVVPAVEGALRRAFGDGEGGAMTAVLIAQRVIGVKHFREETPP